MRTILTIVGDTLVAAVLLIAGFGLDSLLGAPSWLMAVFVLPFLIYLHYRLGVSFRFIFCFVALFTLVSLAFAHFLPDQYRIYSEGLVVVLLSPLATKFHRKEQASHDPMP
jgi:hypothetical protein